MALLFQSHNGLTAQNHMEMAAIMARKEEVIKPGRETI